MARFRPRDTRRLESRYTTAIVRLFESRAKKAVREALPRIEAAYPAELKQDAEDDVRRVIQSAMRRGRPDQRSAQREARKIAGQLDKQQQRDVIDAVGGALEVQPKRPLVNKLAVNPLGSEPWLRAVLRQYVKENVELITSISDRFFEELEAEVVQAVESGLRFEDLAKRIEGRFLVGGSVGSASRLGVARRRAELIAKDQIGKLKSQLDRERYKGLGSRRYTWRTSRDERVRDEHARREGREYEWTSPPPDGHPGEPIRCRCTAEPLFDDLEDPDTGPTPPRRKRRPRRRPPPPRPQPQPQRPQPAQPERPPRLEPVMPLPEDPTNPRPGDAVRPEAAVDLDGLVDALVDAEKLPEVPGRRKDADVVPPTDLGRVVRREVRNFARRFGLTPNSDRNPDVLAIDPSIDGSRAAAYHTWGGAVAIQTSRAKAAARFARGERHHEPIDATRIIIHEEMHGFSPIQSRAYRDVGQGIEEATTELTARWITDSLVGEEHYRKTPTRGSYRNTIRHMWKGLGAAITPPDGLGGRELDDAVWDLLYRASFRFKQRVRSNGVRTMASPQDVEEAFLQDIATEFRAHPKLRSGRLSGMSLSAHARTWYVRE